MSASIGQLIPEMQPFARDLVSAAGAAGLHPRVTSTRRSFAEQTRLYRRFLSGLNPYPVAAPGTSAHEAGYAMDLVVTPMSALDDVGAYWEANGGVWGGKFRDPIHFEFPGFTAQTPFEPSLYDKTLNFALSFVPYLGGTQLALMALSVLFPDLNQTDLYDMIQNPLLHLERWASVQKRWIG